jgi:hypothetical protein
LWSSPSAGGGGQYPAAALLQGSDGALYAATSGGGDLGFGTISRFVLPPVLLNPAALGNTFRFQFKSVPNAVYSPQYKVALTDSNWSSLASVLGNGGWVTITDTNLDSRIRFYRVVMP